MSLSLEFEFAENEDQEQQSGRVTSSNWVVVILKFKTRLRYAEVITDLK